MPTAPKKKAAPTKPQPSIKYCPRCYRTEADLDQCPNEDFPGHRCPEPKAAEANSEVTLKCGPCGFTRVMPVGDLLKGKAQKELPRCRRDTCAAKIV